MFVMRAREFRDSKGVAWRVWKTLPTLPSMYSDERRNGWLMFESDTERRLLAPIPSNWEEAGPPRLEYFSRVAIGVSCRRSAYDGWFDERRAASRLS